MIRSPGIARKPQDSRQVADNYHYALTAGAFCEGAVFPTLGHVRTAAPVHDYTEIDQELKALMESSWTLFRC